MTGNQLLADDGQKQSGETGGPIIVRVRPRRRWWHEIPMPVFYIPIGLAVLFLMLRHRSLDAPLCANFGLEHGGLFPASKQAFFELFPRDSGLVPESLRLPADSGPDEIREQFAAFCGKLGGTPERFTLKPDDGVRGQDILFLVTLEELLSFWTGNQRGDGDWLLQEFVGGAEAALFYNRPEAEGPGRIVSMTVKWGFPVTGDGTSTIGELIARADGDDATRRLVVANNPGRLDEVPQAGTAVDIVGIRNHRLGATFQDVSHLITPELESAVCSVLDRIEGYQYGRLDVRVPDFASLLAGRGIKVLEANALYSEPVHAYDPKYGLRQAYRIFIAHWHMAIRTGLNNLQAGKPRISFLQTFLRRESGH